MKNSVRIDWFERAYRRLREDLLPDLPAAVNITVGFPSKKRKGGNLCVGECAYEAFQGKGLEFGEDHLITIHPILFDDPSMIRALEVFVHELAHVIAGPDAGHKKEYQAIAKEAGLVPVDGKKWTSTVANDQLRNYLFGLAEELGDFPPGMYVPPPPKPPRPTQNRKCLCACPTPRKLTLAKSKLDKGDILCGLCKEPFRPIDTPSEG